MAKLGTLTTRVRFKWWLQPYLDCLVFFAKLTDRLPDPEKLERILQHGVVITIVQPEEKPNDL